MQTLPEAMAAKIKEMNEVIIPAYVGMIPISPPTAIVVNVMRAEVQDAVEALASGDLIHILGAWANIKDYRL